MRPLLQDFRAFESERLHATTRVYRDGRKRVLNLRRRDALREFHRTEMVTVEALGEIPQDGVVLVRRDPFDDQLLASHAERYRGAVLQQRIDAPRDSGRRTLDKRMSRRIERVLVQADRKLDQEIGKFLGQRRRGFPNRRKAAQIGNMVAGGAPG